jgi:tetratricopeptide (TPR) repeat protein
MDNKNYREALIEIEQILALEPNDVGSIELRATAHQSLGQFREAVDDWKKILSFESVAAGDRRPLALNALAYARSLANIEFDEGLVNVDEALRLTRDNAEMLDTRGFLYYRQGDYERAIKDLNNAVDFAEGRSAPSTSDPRIKAKADKAVAQSLAVIHYHRALIHDARKEKDKAEEDRRRVRELGFEPNENLF